MAYGTRSVARRPVIVSLRSGSRHDVRVNGITSEGAGVGRLSDGRVVFVHRTAPGDLARVEIDQVKARWARGHLVELLEPGPDRREPPCPFYSRCGGCAVEHLVYPAQLRVKRKLVTDALERIGKRAELPDPSVHPSARETRYRNRVTFTLRRMGKDHVAAGFHELERPGRVVDVDGSCLLPEEPLAEVWNRLRSAWGPGASSLPSGARLRLTLRGVTSGGVLLLVDGGSEPGDPDTLVANVPGLRAVWWRPAGQAKEEPVLLAGEERIEEAWFGEEVEIEPAAFLQANREVAALLQSHVLAEARPAEGRRVLDAYCGFGLYGRELARSGAVSAGIESDPSAARMAQAHPVQGFRMVMGAVEDRLDEELPVDLVILNPPRVGVGTGVMERIAESRPDRIIYVSCDPATLARDMARLGDGYEIGRIEIFDLFPQTAHVEAVVTLDPKGES